MKYKKSSWPIKATVQSDANSPAGKQTNREQPDGLKTKKFNLKHFHSKKTRNSGPQTAWSPKVPMFVHFFKWRFKFGNNNVLLEIIIM